MPRGASRSEWKLLLANIDAALKSSPSPSGALDGPTPAQQDADGAKARPPNPAVDSPGKN